MRRKSLFLLMALSMATVGCADINTTNKMIVEANKARLDAYAKGMAACGDNAACQVGVSAAYFSGAGQQQLFRPDTPVDYLKAGLPYADLVDRIVARRYGGTSGDAAGFVVTGDGNSFVVGNRLSASDQSFASLGLESSYLRKYEGGGNRTFSGLTEPGEITDEGLVSVKEEAQM